MAKKIHNPNGLWIFYGFSTKSVLIMNFLSIYIHDALWISYVVDIDLVSNPSVPTG